MEESPQVNDSEPVQCEFIEQAVHLVSQQVWCWGRDVLWPEGNWLIEIGFDRVKPPADRENYHSMYTLELPHGRCVVPRGFGMFYGDPQWGGVFLPRFEFRPAYTMQAKLERPPWTISDLPRLLAPTESQRTGCASLTLGLIDWIQTYEATVVERLGIEYRRSTLAEWDDGQRPGTPAEDMVQAWQELKRQVAANFDAFSRPTPHE